MKKVKKFLSVLALIVLVGSDILTSFSYALEDIVGEFEIVRTEIGDSGEIEDVEGDGVEESKEETEDEKIEEENGAQETVEGATGAIVEELTGFVEELTGTVDENIGTGEETIIEEKKYNEEPIIGEKIYNDVTVRVESLTGIFPEGAELMIEPMKSLNLSSLKDKLVAEKEEIKKGNDGQEFSATLVGDDSARNDFHYKTITISDNTHTYTLMDRNLGARVAWDPEVEGNGFSDDNSENYDTASDYYGYYYQWGNSYGFSKITSINVGTVILNAIPSNYVTTKWLTYNYPSSYNLRGDTTDTESARQGPCPRGWHVPSADEWVAIKEAWCMSYNNTENCQGVGRQFAEALQMPTAGYRMYSSCLNPPCIKFYSRGSNGYYWSSTSNDNSKANYLFFRSSNVSSNTDNRVNGLPVRCLKNNIDAVTLYLNPNGGRVENAIIDADVQGKVTLSTATRDEYEFEGWFASAGESEKIGNAGDEITITEDTDLYAHWSEIIPNPIVTFNNGADVTEIAVEGGGTLTKEQIQQISNLTHTKATFDGWYTNPEFNQAFDFNTPITADTSLYAKWTCKEGYVPLQGNGGPDMNCFEYETISYEYDGNKHILMDRNLGAQMIGFLYDADPKSYGYYYQWGNNYGFGPSIAPITSNTQVDCTNINPSTYSSSTFIMGSNDFDWCSSRNNNLWGGENDNEDNGRGLDLNNLTDRQGPCPNGWHVPSIGERQTLLIYWASLNNVTLKSGIPFDYYVPSYNGDYVNYNEFKAEFKIPIAGHFHYMVAQLGGNGGGGSANLWSSSSDINMRARQLQLTMNGAEITANGRDNRAIGESIRCFMNNPKTVTFNYNGGVGENFEINIPSGTKVTAPADPTNGDQIFAGWYASIDGGTTLANTAFDFNEEITQNVDLYAKWVSCEDGEIYSPELGKCVARWHELVSLTDDNTTTTVGSDEPVDGLPTTMTVIENDILKSPEGEVLSEAEGKELVGDITIDFGGKDAKFSHLVKVKIPVEGSSKAYVKVKHVGSIGYNFDGLTSYIDAECNDAGRIVDSDDKYDGEYMDVEDGYVSIYTCEASDFLAFGLPKVTFQPNNNENPNVVEVGDGGTVTAPADPTNGNQIFAGWYTSTDGGQTLSDTAFDFDTPITADITLYAKWEDVKVGITYHFGNSINNPSIYSDSLSFNGSSYLNTDIELFSTENKSKDFEIHLNIDNITYNLHPATNRNDIIAASDEAQGSKYQGFNMRLETSGGDYQCQVRDIGGSENKLTWSFPAGTPSSFDFVKENGIFKSRQNNGSDEGVKDLSGILTSDYPLTFGGSLDEKKIPRRYINGTLSNISVYINYTDGEKITLPSPTLTDMEFVGWYTDAQYQHPVQLDGNGQYTVGVNQDLYPKWRDDSVPTYAVTIDSTIENGTVTANPTSAAEGETVILTATPANGYEFTSWAVADANSNLIIVTDNKFTMPAADVTVSATFTEIPAETYTVTISDEIQNGTVSADKAIAEEGETVTLTVTPAEGYELATLTYTVEGQNPENIDQATKQFVMPAAAVTVGATFELISAKTYTVTFDVNRGTFVDTPDSQTVGGGEHATDPATLPEYNEPELQGYRFDGWWTEPRGGTQWDFANAVVTSDIKLYAHWIYNYDVGDLDVYIVNSAGNLVYSGVMMDRNVGATEVYNQDFAYQNTGSFGYVYQWGNNWGFERCRGNGTTCHGAGTPNPDTSGAKVPATIWQQYYKSKYTSKTWVKPDKDTEPWQENFGTSANLWGHADGYEEKQGPCPDGYHVPLKTEFNDIAEGWNNVYGVLKGYNIFVDYGFSDTEIADFIHDFLFPLAGVHRRGTLEDSEQGGCAEYWTSKPYNTTSAENIFFCLRDSGNTYYNTGNGKRKYAKTTASSATINGSTVRCLKNTNTANLNIEMNGGNSAVITVHKFNGVNTIIALTDPKKTNREFGGWYITNDFQPSSRKNEGNTLPDGDITLYAKWICPIGTVLVGNACEQGVTVSFYDEEATPGVDDPLEQVTVLPGGSVVYPNVDPTKEGYEFDGWVDENGDSDDLSNVTANRNVFASYHVVCNDGYHWNGSACVSDSNTATCDVSTRPANTVTTAGTFNQTWDETEQDFLPLTKAWTYGGSECGYACANGYHYDNGVCILNSYEITWNIKDANGNETTAKINVNHGEVPSYEAAGYTYEHRMYTFASWIPTPVAATAATSYTANYTAGSCVEGYDEIGNACLNEQQVSCDATGIPAHSTAISKTVTITYDGTAWSSPEPCEWTCKSGYDKVGDECVEKEQDKPSGGNMSGGGGRGGSADSEANQNGPAEDENNEMIADWEDGSEFIGSGNFTKQEDSLYKRAKEYGVTTMDSLEGSDPEGLLTRGHLAKMVVNFMVNVQGRKVPYDVSYECLNWNDNPAVWESEEIKYYATRACAFGVMGIDMWNNEFLPDKLVTRAEFGTVVSRILYGDTYNLVEDGNVSYYENHLNVLKDNNILTQIENPEYRREIRKWVWLVFRRILEKKKL